MPEGLAAERHDIAMALLLRLSDVHRWSGNSKEGDVKGGEYIVGGEEDDDYDDYNDDDYFLDLDMCQVCRKVNNARRRLDKSIN